MTSARPLVLPVRPKHRCWAIQDHIQLQRGRRKPREPRASFNSRNNKLSAGARPRRLFADRHDSFGAMRFADKDRRGAVACGIAILTNTFGDYGIKDCMKVSLQLLPGIKKPKGGQHRNRLNQRVEEEAFRIRKRIACRIRRARARRGKARWRPIGFVHELNLSPRRRQCLRL